MDKLKIEIEKPEGYEYSAMTRISRKASALIDDAVKQSGRTRGYIASKMIEFAYDHIEFEGESEDDT